MKHTSWREKKSKKIVGGRQLLTKLVIPSMFIFEHTNLYGVITRREAGHRKGRH